MFVYPTCSIPSRNTADHKSLHDPLSVCPHLVPPHRSVVSCSTMLLSHPLQAVRERIKVCICVCVCVGVGDSMSKAGLRSNRQQGRDECRHQATEWLMIFCLLLLYHPILLIQPLFVHILCERLRREMELPLGTHYNYVTVSDLITSVHVCMFFSSSVPQSAGVEAQRISGQQSLYPERLQWGNHLQVSDQVPLWVGE